MNGIARRLGRPRVQRAPQRSVIGVPDFHRQAPLAGDGELIARFCSELASVGAEAKIVHSPTEVERELRRVLAELRATRIVTWARSELAGWPLDFLWSELGARAYLDATLPDERALKSALLDAEIGLTAVDFAIAGTGSLALSAAAGRPRGVSLLPTVHVALVRSSQLVARLGEALEAYRARADLPSAIHFITGPSRTSDIENDLTIGVHGPAALTVIVLDEGRQAS
ncbi:MAG TPA: LUD domain-containing protein [Polyangiaceae bacterium]